MVVLRVVYFSISLVSGCFSSVSQWFVLVPTETYFYQLVQVNISQCFSYKRQSKEFPPKIFFYFSFGAVSIRMSPNLFIKITLPQKQRSNSFCSGKKPSNVGIIFFVLFLNAFNKPTKNTGMVLSFFCWCIFTYTGKRGDCVRNYSFSSFNSLKRDSCISH